MRQSINEEVYYVGKYPDTMVGLVRSGDNLVAWQILMHLNLPHQPA